MGLWMHVEYRGDWWGEDPLQETDFETTGDLFRALSGRDKSKPWVEPLGRCTGKVYVDIPGSPCELCGNLRSEHYGPLFTWMVEPGGQDSWGRTWPNGAVGMHGHHYQPERRQVGWSFEARNAEPVRRGDTQPTGLREAWVTVYDREPTVVCKQHYADFAS